MAEQIQTINENAMNEKQEILGLDNLEPDTSSSIDTQDINEIVANVPVEIEVTDVDDNEHVLEVRSLTINAMVRVDKAIKELEKVGSEEIDIDDENDIDSYVKKVQMRTQKIFDEMVEVIFLIINPSVKKPSYSREWIQENINVIDEDGSGHQIIDAYNYKCSSTNLLGLVKKILVSKKFA